MRAKLRANGSNGHTKDWCVLAFSHGCEISWGKTGTKLQKRIIPVEQCQGKSPFLEARKRLEKKKKEGYWVIDDSQANINTDSLVDLLRVKRGTLSENHYTVLMEHAVKLVESVFSDANDKISIDSMAPVITLSKYGELVMAPSDSINDAIFTMAVLQLNPKAILVRDINLKSYTAKELYEDLDMSKSLRASSVAMKTGLIVAPEIFKPDAQINTWFF